VWRQDADGSRRHISEDPVSGGTSFEFVDPEPPYSEVSYWLQQIDGDGSEHWHGPATLNAAELPRTTAITRISPNPFNPRTTVFFSVNKPQRVEICIYDLVGRRVTTLVNQKYDPGDYAVEWLGDDAQGLAMPSNTYIVRLLTDDRVASRKALLVR